VMPVTLGCPHSDEVLQLGEEGSSPSTMGVATDNLPEHHRRHSVTFPERRRDPRTTHGSELANPMYGVTHNPWYYAVVDCWSWESEEHGTGWRRLVILRK